MKKITKKISFKLFITATLWISYIISYKIYYPLMSTQSALNQLKDSHNSFTSFALFNEFWNYYPLALILITIIVFIPETICIIKKIGGNNNE